MDSESNNEDINDSIESIQKPASRNDIKFSITKAERLDSKGSMVKESWTSLDVNMNLYLIEEENGQPWIVGYHGQEQFVRMNLSMNAFQHKHKRKMVMIYGESHAKRGGKPIFRQFRLYFKSNIAANIFQYSHNTLYKERKDTADVEEIDQDHIETTVGVTGGTKKDDNDKICSEDDEEHDCFESTQDPWGIDEW